VQSDPHLLGVLGYVEANPLRARMVARAEEWRWSSLGQGTVRQAHDCAGVDGKRLQLTEWPPRPAGRMVERVNAMVANEELERLRSCIRRSRPFGDDAWVRWTARRLGLESTLRDPWRPKKPSPAAKDRDAVVSLGLRPIPENEIGLYADRTRATWPVPSTPAPVPDWRHAITSP